MSLLGQSGVTGGGLDPYNVHALFVNMDSMWTKDLEITIVLLINETIYMYICYTTVPNIGLIINYVHVNDITYVNHM